MHAGRAKARKLTARGAATRERIVAETANLVMAHGVGETSLDDVMEKSGASKSQLYHYFASKDELFIEAAALQASRVLATHKPLLDSLELARSDAPLARRSAGVEQDGRLPTRRAGLPVAARL